MLAPVPEITSNNETANTVFCVFFGHKHLPLTAPMVEPTVSRTLSVVSFILRLVTHVEYPNGVCQTVAENHRNSVVLLSHSTAS